MVEKGLEKERLGHAFLLFGPPWILHKEWLEQEVLSSMRDKYDTLFLVPEKDRFGVERIREALSWASLTSFKKRKAVLVWKAHLLSTIEQNTLLKTLEEPPPFTFFFLFTTLPFLLLETVLSRVTPIELRGEWLPQFSFESRESFQRARALLNWLHFAPEKEVLSEKKGKEFFEEQKDEVLLWALLLLRDRVIKKALEGKRPSVRFRRSLKYFLENFPYLFVPGTNLSSLLWEIYTKLKRP